jgi:pimeloyl-ACP methyl ester carboxylesterase
MSGATPAQVDDMTKGFAALTHYLYHEGKSPKQIIKEHPEMKAIVMENIPDLQTYSGVGIPFFQQLAKKNLMASWEKVNAKVLVLYGENDFISTESDHSYLADCLNKQKPGKAQYVKVPNSDHGFFNTSSPLDSMEKWGRGGTPFNSNIVDILSKWLKEIL